jgi:hypothetical protein
VARRLGCGVLRGGGSPFIGARGGGRAAIMAGIRGETGGGVKGDLSAVKLRFNESNGCGLMVEGGGGSCTESDGKNSFPNKI